MNKINILSFVWLAALVVVLFSLFFQKNESRTLGLAVCTVTESVALVGHQESLNIVPAGARSWVIVQQPQNATNTVSLSLAGAAVAGQGYQLYATSSFSVGFSTDYPTGAPITARTSGASSTVNVILCR